MRSDVRATAGSVLLLGVFAAGCALDRTREEQAVRALWQQFEQAFNDGDAATAASLYAEDGDRIDARGNLVSGRAQIEAGYRALLARRAADSSTAPLRATIDVRLLGADVALLDGRWTGTRVGVAVCGRFTLVASRRDGRWQFVAGRDLGVIEQS